MVESDCWLRLLCAMKLVHWTHRGCTVCCLKENANQWQDCVFLTRFDLFVEFVLIFFWTRILLLLSLLLCSWSEKSGVMVLKRLRLHWQDINLRIVTLLLWLHGTWVLVLGRTWRVVLINPRRVGGVSEAFVSFVQSRKNGEICALSFLQLVFLCHGLAQTLHSVLFVAVLEISLLNGVSLGVGCQWLGMPSVLYLGLPRLHWLAFWLMRLFCALHLRRVYVLCAIVGNFYLQSHVGPL